MNALLVYFQHANSSDYYQQGHKVSDRFKLSTDVSLLRYIHSIGLAEGVAVEPQAILPYSHLRASGKASSLGETTGTGDLILGAPVKWTLDTAHKDIFSVAPYLYVPTGSYERGDALNLGENRWRLLLQSAYIHHFNEQRALDTAADVSWFSHNDDYNRDGATLKQQARYEYQAYLRYNLTPRTQFAVGGGRLIVIRTHRFSTGLHCTGEPNGGILLASTLLLAMRFEEPLVTLRALIYMVQTGF
jgi:hypothetical protein